MHQVALGNSGEVTRDNGWEVSPRTFCCSLGQHHLPVQLPISIGSCHTNWLRASSRGKRCTLGGADQASFWRLTLASQPSQASPAEYQSATICRQRALATCHARLPGKRPVCLPRAVCLRLSSREPSLPSGLQAAPPPCFLSCSRSLPVLPWEPGQDP